MRLFTLDKVKAILGQSTHGIAAILIFYFLGCDILGININHSDRGDKVAMTLIFKRLRRVPRRCRIFRSQMGYLA